MEMGFCVQVPTEEELAVKVYSDRINVDAKKIMNWLKSNIDRLEKKVSDLADISFESWGYFSKFSALHLFL